MNASPYVEGRLRQDSSGKRLLLLLLLLCNFCAVQQCHRSTSEVESARVALVVGRENPAETNNETFGIRLHGDSQSFVQPVSLEDPIDSKPKTAAVKLRSIRTRPSYRRVLHKWDKSAEPHRSGRWLRYSQREQPCGHFSDDVSLSPGETRRINSAYPNIKRELAAHGFEKGCLWKPQHVRERIR